MKRIIMAAVLLGITTGAQAEWKDVEYSASLPANAVYCDGLGTFKDFVAFIQDGDEAGASRMIDSGDCAATSKVMQIHVFQEDGSQGAITFLSPSGKAFYTLKGYLQ